MVQFSKACKYMVMFFPSYKSRQHLQHSTLNVGCNSEPPPFTNIGKVVESGSGIPFKPQKELECILVYLPS